MKTYETLKRISAERLADEKVYWPINEAPDLRFLASAKFSLELNEGNTFYGEDLSIGEYDLKLAHSLGIQAARLTAISFGYFDGSRTVQALPMYASSEIRSKRTITGSRHFAIVNDYWDKMHKLDIADGFSPVRGQDVFSGECLLRRGDNYPTSYFNVYDETDLDDEKSQALEEMAQQFPNSKYIIVRNTKVLARFTGSD